MNALYGCINSVLLWYKLCSDTLNRDGFFLNPYDLYIANKTIEDKYFTLTWYVDDLKISHVRSSIIDSGITTIESNFVKMTVTGGKKHVHVRIEIEFIGNRKVKLVPKDHMTNCIKDFVEDMLTYVSSPTQKGLFDVNEDGKLLREDMSATFHSVVQKLLFIGKRSHPDLQLTISFLYTSIQSSNVIDWKKLKRLLQFFKRSIDEKLRVLAENGFTFMNTWNDASCAVHSDRNSHTGGYITL